METKTIYLPDGSFIQNGKRVFVVPFDQKINKSELIGAVITEIGTGSFKAKISEKTIRVNIEQHEYTEDEEAGMDESERSCFVIGAFEIDA